MPPPLTPCGPTTPLLECPRAAVFAGRGSSAADGERADGGADVGRANGGRAEGRRRAAQTEGGRTEGGRRAARTEAASRGRADGSPGGGADGRREGGGQAEGGGRRAGRGRRAARTEGGRRGRRERSSGGNGRCSNLEDWGMEGEASATGRTIGVIFFFKIRCLTESSYYVVYFRTGTERALLLASAAHCRQGQNQTAPRFSPPSSFPAKLQSNQFQPFPSPQPAMASHATTPTPPPPPPSEPKAATDMKPPPPPPRPLSAAESDAPSKKRKLEEMGFHHSPYYKIRAAVANLRGRFLQVCQASDSQKKDAALEILKEIRVLMELSKKMRIDISASTEPVKPLDIPAVRAVKNKPAGNVPPGEKYQVPQIGQAAMFLHSTGDKVPLKPVSSQTAAKRLQVETQREAKPNEITNLTNQLGERVQGSYVVGGSPIGWNFLMWPGGKAVYYGLTRAEWLARQAAK